jgi:hypothetical protein
MVKKNQQVVCDGRNDCFFAGGDDCHHREEHSECDCGDSVRPHICRRTGNVVRCHSAPDKNEMDKVKKQIDIVYDLMERYKKEKEKLRKMLEESTTQ